MHPAEKLSQLVPREVRVEDVIEDFTERNHGIAIGQRHGPKRSLHKTRLGSFLTGQANHGAGNVDAEHIATGAHDLSRENAAAAPEIDYKLLA